MTAQQGIEFIVMPKATYVWFNNGGGRRIYTDGRAWPQDEEPAFVGYSIGHWLDTDSDGRLDTLEVETRNFKGPRTFDGNGHPLHEDNKTVIQERIYLDKSDPGLLRNDITTIDNALTTAPLAILTPSGKATPSTWALTGSGGNGSLSGQGVTIFLMENSQLYINANEQVNLSPPTSGPYAGITIFQAHGDTQALTGCSNMEPWTISTSSFSSKAERQASTIFALTSTRVTRTSMVESP